MGATASLLNTEEFSEMSKKLKEEYDTLTSEGKSDEEIKIQMTSRYEEFLKNKVVVAAVEAPVEIVTTSAEATETVPAPTEGVEVAVAVAEGDAEAAPDGATAPTELTETQAARKSSGSGIEKAKKSRARRGTYCVIFRIIDD